MSVSVGLVGNIALSTRLLPTDDDGLLPSTLLIYDGFLCFCDELWPSLIAIFFVVCVFDETSKIRPVRAYGRKRKDR